MKKKIFIVDKLVAGYNHVGFNAAFTAIIANIYKNHEVVFVSEALHSAVIADINQSVLNLKYQPYIETPLPAGRINITKVMVSRKLNSLSFLKKLYKTELPEAEAVFFTCLSSASMVYAARKAKNINIPAYFFIHGEIEYLFKNVHRKIEKVRRDLYKIFLKQIGGKVKILVLTDLIKQKLVSGGYVPLNNISVVEHPIAITQQADKHQTKGKAIFGHIGMAMLKKNSALFFDVARAHLSAVENGAAEFRMIGKIEPELNLNDTAGVTLVSETNASLDQETYQINIADIDYSLFVFDTDNYVYRISGSLMDAIAFAKPIIALRQDYFSYLFDTAGNIGFLCDNAEDMNRLISQIINKEESIISQYEIQKDNLKKLLDKQSMAQITRQLAAAVCP